MRESHARSYEKSGGEHAAAYTGQWPPLHDYPESGHCPPNPDCAFDPDWIDVKRSREKRDATVSCDHCDAVCCRLTVVLMPEDRVPNQFVVEDKRGMQMLAKGEEGWCQALDLNTMRCTIYEMRPAICRKFAMGGPYCRSERDAWRGIASTLVS